MKNVLGTNAFGGLDVSKAGQLIADSSLVKSVNGWTGKEGALKVADGQDRLYTGYSAISCFSAGRQGGSDKLLWMDGNNVYVDGSVVGTVAAGTDMYSRDFDDNFYIMGSSNDLNYLYDGTLLRQHGCWQIDEYSSYRTRVKTAVTDTISAITKATDCVITVGSNSLVVGDNFYVDGVVGMTELNGRLFIVKSRTALTITIEEDSTDFGTYSSAGTVYEMSCGITGDYKYYMVPTVKFVDSGKVIFGKPRGIPFGEKKYTDYDVDDSWDAETVTLAPTNEVTFDISFIPSFTCSGTSGTDYLYGLRIYRTKAYGADFYLEHEFEHGDDGFVLSGSTYHLRLDHYPSGDYRSATTDVNLGAVYLPGLNDHEIPPAASLMALVGQRLYMNDTDNPNRIYFTGLDGVDYVPTLNYLTIPDVITGIGAAGSVCVVFSCDRMWRISMLGGIPDMDEIETSVGTTYGKAMFTSDSGLLFLREDGVWVTNGSSPPQKFGRQAFDTMTSPKSITAYGDITYIGGEHTAYVMLERAGGSYWHEHSVYHTIADATNGKFYAASDSSVYELFAGDSLSAEMQTKDFIYYGNSLTPGQPHEFQAVRVVLDYEGNDIPVVWVNGNRESDYDGHPDEGTDDEGNRRLLRFSIARLHNHVFNITVEWSGNGTIYGAWLETE